MRLVSVWRGGRRERSGENESHENCGSCLRRSGNPTGEETKGTRCLASEGTNGTRVSAKAGPREEPVPPGSAPGPRCPWPQDGLQTLGFKAQKQQNTHVLSRLCGNTGTLASKHDELLNRCRAFKHLHCHTLRTRNVHETHSKTPGSWGRVSH